MVCDHGIVLVFPDHEICLLCGGVLVDSDE